MAAHFFLLFLFLERHVSLARAGLLKEDRDVHIVSSEGHRVLPHLEPVDSFLKNFKDLEIPHQSVKDNSKTLPRTSRKPNHLGFMDDIAAKSPLAKRSLELAVNRRKRSTLTNEEVEGVINAQSLVPSSEEYTRLPDLHLETGVSSIVLERMRQRTKWVMESEDGGPRSRHRRSWLWNQFFVIEEYRGPEPVLIGRVRFYYHQSEMYFCDEVLFIYCFIFQHFQTMFVLPVCTLQSTIPKSRLLVLKQHPFLSITHSFLHPLSGQTAHLHRVSLTGLVYLFPLSPLTLQTDDLMQIEIASLGSRVV